MPGTLVKRNELQNGAGAFDQQMRRDPEMGDGREVRVRSQLELPAKKLLDGLPAKLAWRQTDIVDNDHINGHISRAFIMMG